MKQFQISILLTVLMSMFGAKAFAYDIEVANKDGVTIYYKWINGNTELSVTFQGDNYYWSRYYSGDVVIPESVEYEGKTYSVTSIGGCAFQNNSELTSVTIPNSVSSIGMSAFEDCSALTSVTIPNSVTSIGGWVFAGCSSLNSIIVESGNQYYDSRDQCNAIINSSTNELIAGCKNTVIPNSVTSIGQGAFYNCSGLTSITFGNSVTSIGVQAFLNCSGLTSLTIPSSVTSIGNNAFSGCSGLSSIIVEDGNIAYDSRNNCNAIIEKSSNTLIAGCNNTTIPEGVTSIGGSAFKNCSGLTSLTIPSSVTSIGKSAFEGCSGLTDVYCHAETVPTTASDAFDNSNIANATLHVPVGCKAAYASATGWKDFGTILEGNEGTTFTAKTAEGWDMVFTILDESAKTCQVGYLDATWNQRAVDYEKVEGSLTIPETVNGYTVVRIGKNSLNNIDGMTSVTIPNTVTSIEDDAFFNCDGLISFELPASVTSIGTDALSALWRDISVKVAEGNTKYDSRDNCNAIIETATNKLLFGFKTTIIPATVTEIGERAFYNILGDYIGDYTLTIPSTITRIGDDAFGISNNLILQVEHTTPLEISENVFGGLSNSILRVSAGCKAAYASATGWKNFGTILEGNEGTTFTAKTTEGWDMVFTILDESEKTCQVGYLDGAGDKTAIDKHAVIGSVTIPQTIEGYTVVKIGKKALYNAYQMTSVTIPNTVTAIDEFAFAYCHELTSFELPASVTTIGDGALIGQESVTSIKVAEGNQNYDSRDNCNAIIETGSNTLIAGCKTTIIPNTVTSIRKFAFNRMSLTSIIIPGSVTSINQEAFGMNSELTDVYCLAANVPTTYDTAFRNTPIGNATLHVLAGSIEDYQAASPWSGFKEVVAIETKKTINVETAGTLSTLIPETEKYLIEDLTLTGNLNGDDLALIRDMAGNNINGHLTDGRLATLDLSGASIVDGGTYVQFTEEKYYIDADNYVIVKDTKPYTSQANVFRGFLFAGCGALETITLPNTLLSISNSSTFSDCKKLTTIYIPASVGYMDSGFTNCPSLTSVVIDPNNVKYESPNNNVIIDKETHALITGCKDAVIPTDKGINSISKYAFLGRIGETTMEIPEGITSIGDYAFAQTGITSVVLPSTLVTIDNRAFQGCNQLTEIVIPASVKTIGDNAFSQCSSLKTVTSQIVDPSTVTVGNNAFAYYSIDLIVPVGSVSAYKAAEPWKKFREILDINEMQKSIRSINVEKAGTLSTFISDEDKFVILELTLTGELNGTDFRLLREMAGCGYNGRETNGKLRTLDLSGIRIVADAEDSEGYLNATQVINDSGGYGVNKGEDLPLRTKDDIFGDCLFAGCNRIRSIKFPAGIKEMGHDLFTLAGQGLDIVIPKDVTYIHPNAFNGHPYAKGSFKVEEGNQVYSSPNNCNAIVKGTTLEVGCKNTVIPEGITTIGPGAFDYQRGCPALPESVTRIESRAFYYANASTVTLPKNLQFIGSGAFASFAEPDLKTVYSEIVDPSVVTLEGNPFGSSPIEVLYVPEGSLAAYEAIPAWKNSFSAILEKGTALEQLTLHVETAGTLPTLIPEEKKNHIVQLTLTGNLNGTDFRLIREMAGNDYLGQPTRGLLKKLDISGANIVEGGEKYLDTDRVNSSTGNYTQMGGDFFHFGTQNNVLGNSLFAGCGKLEEIVLPNSITSIGEYVFWYCLNLKALEIPKNVSSIGLNFVYGQNKLSKLTVAEGNMTYSSPANSNALMQGSKLVFGIQNTQIPEGTTVIGANAFASHGPWQVTLPEGVTTIESYAFSQTILGILNMPSTLTTIGPGAFEGCWQQLRSFTLPKSVTSIDGSAFLHCSNLTEMKVEEGNPVYDSRENCNAIIETGSNTLIAGCKNTIIPNSVTTIGQYAFGGIGLTTITIPSSVTSIDHMAFCENTELSDVYCNAESVPNTETDAFSSVHIEQVTLHVPAGSVEAYKTESPWKDFGMIRSIVTSLFDGTNLWTSYVAQEDYAIPAGLEAYVISSLSETSAVASQIDYIPQGVPLLLKRNDATTNSFDFATGSGTAPTTNLLKVYDTDKTVSNREGYILFKDEFVLVDEGTLPAGRVFLPLNGGNAASTRGIVIEGEGTTGIQNLVSDSEVSHGVWYDLQGRKIDGKPIKKGVYILNGRKVVVK